MGDASVVLSVVLSVVIVCTRVFKILVGNVNEPLEQSSRESHGSDFLGH